MEVKQIIVTTNSVKMTNACRPTGVRKVMGSIPVGDSDFFFVPRSRHVDYSVFSYFFSKLKIHHLSLFITYKQSSFTGFIEGK